MTQAEHILHAKVGKSCHECFQARNARQVKISAIVDDQGRGIFLNEGWGDDTAQE